jgi:pSer/pThr/pTyr-binding forkhead associated (FHA) protein
VAILIITHGNRTIRRELDDKPTVVGRDPGCDLFFADKRLSRQHARFEATEAGVRLLDLESRNGTWVNQTRIKEVILTPDDTVRIGSLTISLEAAPSEMPTTAKLAGGPDESRELIEDEDDKGVVAPPPTPAESSQQEEA